MKNDDLLQYPVKHIPIKRLFDIFFSLFCLLIGFPVFLIIAGGVYFSSSGPVFYSHLRIGRGGKNFYCYKFRTMYPDSDQRLKKLLAEDLSLKKEWETSYKLKNDPRVTPLGSFLRKTSLDELPQFWNVLKGDLSVVGPRPVVQEEVDKYLKTRAYKILSVRPGLTGPWQVSGRSDIICYLTRMQLDEAYVDNRSFLLDVKLVAQTIPAMLFSRGAY